MKMIARSYMWWPSIDKSSESIAKSCQVCHEAKQTPANAPLHPWTWPSKPWQHIHLDFTGPFMASMFIVVVDAHFQVGRSAGNVKYYNIQN